MAGVINSTARQVDLRFRVKDAQGVSVVRTVTLNPGFNIVNDEAWEMCIKNPIAKKYVAMGIIIGNARQSKEDELIKKKVKDDLERQIHNIPRTPGVASLAPKNQSGYGSSFMNTNKGSPTAVAVNAGPGDRTIYEKGTAAAADDDLLG